jgi:hypothetical protein
MQTKANEGNSAVRARAGMLFTAAAAVLLVPVVWQPATSSPSPGDPTGLVVVAAGWAAWALTIYLALATGIAAVGHLAGAPRSIERLTPRALRRLVEVAVGASSAAAVCLAPAAAYADAPVPGPVAATPVASASPLDWPGLAPAPAPPPHLRVAPQAHPQPHDSQRAPAQPAMPLLVRPGDSLWSLTARQLGPRATAARVAATWPGLYAANRRVIGTNPNLIRPGERLVRPTPQGRTSR